ncbi:MAG TPA: YihY/virulence factor BrkB family protein [Terracidiphilus sp.]
MPKNAILLPVTRMKKFLAKFKLAFREALAHDMINTAKAAAYSAMLMVFPALLVATTLLSQAQEGNTLMGEIRAMFEQFLPADTMDLLQAAVLTHTLHSLSVILSAASLSIFASLGVMLSLMEGFRRAYRIPEEGWSFWARRLRALMLVPIILIPLTVATGAIVFGHQIEQWMIDVSGHDLRRVVVFLWRIVRWSVALSTTASVLTVLYHFGTKRTERWLRVVPGAITGTLIWFPATLAFGWYVMRDENYSRFYGPFAAGIATLVWLYITAFSVLLGAELNGALYRDRQQRETEKRVPAVIPFHS